MTFRLGDEKAIVRENVKRDYSQSERQHTDCMIGTRSRQISANLPQDGDPTKRQFEHRERCVDHNASMYNSVKAHNSSCETENMDSDKLCENGYSEAAIETEPFSDQNCGMERL